MKDPCRLCIVKSMCLKECESLEDYIRYINDIHTIGHDITKIEIHRACIFRLKYKLDIYTSVFQTHDMWRRVYA